MISHVSVVVPAADEEELIGACLLSVRAALAHLHASARQAPSADVTVVLDSCRDRTGEVVARFPWATGIVSEARCVGAARAVGTDAALVRRRDAARVWTAHTDADSQVPQDWLTRMVRAADDGADLVLGTVRPGVELPHAARRAWQAVHSAADGHEHVHGANLGVRASTLRAAGGWRPLHTAEDVDLADRVHAIGACIVRTGAAPVLTSSRPDGRAPMGFSSYLRALTEPPREGTRR